MQVNDRGAPKVPPWLRSESRTRRREAFSIMTITPENAHRTVIARLPSPPLAILANDPASDGEQTTDFPSKQLPP